MSASPSPVTEPRYKIGWYQIAFAGDIPAGAVRTLRYFGRDFVAFRDRGGRLSVVDPYCPHLGAHLGHGSKVVDGQLECRFHGWRFDGDGRCKHIPYSDGVPRKARLRRWTTVEKHGGVYLYFDPERRHVEPTYAVPDVDRGRSSRWLAPYFDRAVGRLQPYDLLENGVDMGHFVHIHGFERLPVIDAEVDGPVFRVAFGSTVGFVGRKVDVNIEAGLYGPGITLQWLDTGIRLYAFLNPTPVDAETSEVFVTNLVDATSLPFGLRRVISRFFAFQFMFNLDRDVQIFSRRANPRHPVLCAGDGPIIKYRTWFRNLPDAGGASHPDLLDIREPRARRGETRTG